jgi:hypothetical protein
MLMVHLRSGAEAPNPAKIRAAAWTPPLIPHNRSRQHLANMLGCVGTGVTRSDNDRREAFEPGNDRGVEAVEAVANAKAVCVRSKFEDG